MSLAHKIAETARAIGMDPVDLATIISYETAGTFDPKKAGPTTQWGQHRGLIQFGEPQARKFGVDWDNPVDSQLGADGAVAKYFKSSGFKPGMGLLDAYSTVNAGAPGLHNRSDAKNGGAPGTVADKVKNQMSGHRRKAEALMASLSAPQEAPQGTETALGTLYEGTTGGNALQGLSQPDERYMKYNALMALLQNDLPQPEFRMTGSPLGLVGY